MTINEIKTQLITHFCDKPTFGIENFEKIVLEKDVESHRTDLLHAALNELVEDGLILKINQNLWMLKGDAGNISTQFELSLETSAFVARTIETFFKANNIEHEPIDPMQIGEREIQTLLHIINQILEK